MVRAWILACVAWLALAGCSGRISTSDLGGGDGGSPLGDGSVGDGATAFDGSGGDGAIAPGALTAGQSTLTLDAAGQTRTILLYVPAQIASGPLPLVIALHGNGDTNSNFVAALGLSALADSDGFVLAAPQGITQTFSVGGQTVSGVDWDAYRSTAMGNIDLPMLEALRTQLLATGSIDPHRVMVFGYSQGGYLSFRYGMDDSGALACAAVIAASDPLPGAGLVANAARKIPVALQIGVSDPALANARSTDTELVQNGNPVQYTEVPNAGHVPFPGSVSMPLDYCRGQTLP